MDLWNSYVEVKNHGHTCAERLHNTVRVVNTEQSCCVSLSLITSFLKNKITLEHMQTQ